MALRRDQDLGWTVEKAQLVRDALQELDEITPAPEGVEIDAHSEVVGALMRGIDIQKGLAEQALRYVMEPRGIGRFLRNIRPQRQTPNIPVYDLKDDDVIESARGWTFRYLLVDGKRVMEYPTLDTRVLPGGNIKGNKLVNPGRALPLNIHGGLTDKNYDVDIEPLFDWEHPEDRNSILLKSRLPGNNSIAHRVALHTVVDFQSSYTQRTCLTFSFVEAQRRVIGLKEVSTRGIS